MDEKFTSDVPEEEKGEVDNDGGNGEPPKTFLSATEGINTLRKYLIKFDVDGCPSSTENEVLQKDKQQQLDRKK